ncbi:MAG: antitoxin [Deltaproteobacteria bacterium]|nr:antitoxin [Deltaproteobacteria bacterium]
MKTITVRGLDEIIAKNLKRMAGQNGKSVNQFVLDTLKERLGLNKEKKYTVIHHDMDHLFGIWSENEFKRIQANIDSERKIDKELWK